MPRYHITVKRDHLDAFKVHLAELVDAALSNRAERITHYDDIDELLAGTRPPKDYPIKDASTVTNPLTQIRVKAVTDRITDSIFGSRPVARFYAVTGRDDTGQDWEATAREATDWFDWAARQPTELNAETVTSYAISDYTRYGIGCIKVVHHTDRYKSGKLNANGEWDTDPSPKSSYTGPRWFYVSPRDLLWPRGFSDDVQSLPFIGQVSRRTVSQLRVLSHPDVLTYSPQAVEDVVKSLGEEPPSFDASEASRGATYHAAKTEIIELWIRYDIDGDGIDEELICDYHPDSHTILRLIYATYPRRPFFVSRLLPYSGTEFDAHGIPDILKPVQDQIDALHNLALDAGRVAVRSLILAREGSALGDYLSDDSNEIGVGTTLVTENPTADVNIVPLGTPGPALQALQLLEYLHRDARELVGVGSAQLGDVSQARRASAFGVQAIMQEGSTFTRAASRRFANTFSSAVLSTFELLRLYGSDGRVYRVTGQDGLWVERLLTFPESIPSTWAVRIAIADPDSSPEALVQRNLILAQFGLTWLRDLAPVIQALASPDVPDTAKLGYAELARVSEEFVRRVLESSRDMQDPNSLLVNLNQLLPILMQAGHLESQATPAPVNPQPQPQSQPQPQR